MEALWKKRVEAKLTQDDFDYFDSLIQDMEVTGQKIMPPLRIIRDPGIVNITRKFWLTV